MVRKHEIGTQTDGSQWTGRMISLDSREDWEGSSEMSYPGSQTRVESHRSQQNNE